MRLRVSDVWPGHVLEIETGAASAIAASSRHVLDSRNPPQIHIWREVNKMGEKEPTLKELEEEVRRELGISQIGPQMTTEEAGRLGGYMVKKLIERGEKAMKAE